MSNKYSRTRANPGRPKICISKSKPKPWIFIPPWPPGWLCFTGTAHHNLAPSEDIPWQATLTNHGIGLQYDGSTTFLGLTLLAGVHLIGLGLPATFDLSLWDGQTIIAQTLGTTDPIPYIDPWIVAAHGTPVGGMLWDLIPNTVASGACPTT